MKVLDYFYFTFYKYASRSGRNDIAEHSAYMLFSIVVLTNLFFVLKKLGLDYLYILPSKATSFLMCIPVMGLFYFIFVHKQRLKK